MSETSGKQVTVSLTFDTDVEPGIVQAAVISKIDDLNKILVSVAAYGFDPAAPRPELRYLYEVHSVDEHGRAQVTHRLIDGDRADKIARDIQGLVVEMPVLADHRQSGGPAARPEPLIDPDCAAGKCSSCVGGPCEHDCHQKSVPLTDPKCPTGRCASCTGTSCHQPETTP